MAPTAIAATPRPAIVLLSHSASEHCLGHFKEVMPSIAKAGVLLVHYKTYEPTSLALLPTDLSAGGAVEEEGAVEGSGEGDTAPSLGPPRFYCQPGALADGTLLMEPTSAPAAGDGNSDVVAFYVAGALSFGGPMGVYETDVYPFIATAVSFVRAVVRADLPFLGICFGSQLLAVALGGVGYKHTIAEAGFVPQLVEPHASYATSESAAEAKAKGVFNWFGARTTLMTFHAHGDTFTMPPNTVRIATGPHCPNQAFQVPHKRVVGVQWHPDVTPLKAKISLEKRMAAAGLTAGDLVPPGLHTFEEMDALLAEGRLMAETLALADSIFGEWLAGVYERRDAEAVC